MSVIIERDVEILELGDIDSGGHPSVKITIDGCEHVLRLTREEAKELGRANLLYGATMMTIKFEPGADE